MAALDFASGVTARLTNSIAAPTDHRTRIIGNRGELWADTYRDYEAPVRLERFDPVALKARNARTLRRHAALGAAFRVPLVRPVPPGGGRRALHAPSGGPKGILRSLRQRQELWPEMGELCHADRAHRLGHQSALRYQYVNLLSLRDDLFRLVSLLGHFLSSIWLKSLLQGGPLSVIAGGPRGERGASPS